MEAAPAQSPTPRRFLAARLFLLVLVTGGFGLLFAALLVPPASSCQLTYDTAGVISESEMRVWASRVDWTLTHPRYDSTRRACTCSVDADPTAATTKTPVWIAPGDMVTLFESTLPASFVKKYKRAFAPEDHVKVCLAQEKLTELWNRGACHRPSSSEESASGEAQGVSQGVAAIFTGWDGDLYCASVRCNPGSYAQGQIDFYQNKGYSATCSCNSALTKEQCQDVIIERKFQPQNIPLIYDGKQQSCGCDWTRCVIKLDETRGCPKRPTFTYNGQSWTASTKWAEDQPWEAPLVRSEDDCDARKDDYNTFCGITDADSKWTSESLFDLNAPRPGTG